MDIKRMQRDMQAIGVYDGAIDGLWGPKSDAGYRRVMSVAGTVLKKETPVTRRDRHAMAWGKKVDTPFKQKVEAICVTEYETFKERSDPVKKSRLTGPARGAHSNRGLILHHRSHKIIELNHFLRFHNGDQTPRHLQSPSNG